METTIRTSFSLTGLVFLVFLVLKLAEVGAVATWSWWLVTSPLWIPVVAVLVIMLAAIPFAILEDRRRWRERMERDARWRRRGR